MNTLERNRRGDQALLDRASLALTSHVGLELVQIHTHADPAVNLVRKDGIEVGPWHATTGVLQGGTLTALVARLKRGPQPAILVTEYVNPNQAETLRNLEVPFIDTAGNAYVNDPGLYLYVTGRTKPGGHDPQRGQRAFRPAELKIIFLFLCDPTAVNFPYRDLAQRAGVALGNVAHTVKMLEAQHYLVRPKPRERHLVNQRDLVDRWVADYIARLRPGLVLGRYQSQQAQWWSPVDLAPLAGQWGGEIAAAHWTQYLKPATATIYLEGNPAALVLKHALTKSQDGDVELLHRFWSRDLDVDDEFVPPLLAYADLLAIGGARNMDAATELFEAKLAPHFEET